MINIIFITIIISAAAGRRRRQRLVQHALRPGPTVSFQNFMFVFAA